MDQIPIRSNTNNRLFDVLVDDEIAYCEFKFSKNHERIALTDLRRRVDEGLSQLKKAHR